MATKTDLINHDDGTVEIICEIDGFVERGWVTSHHLVPAKERQLKSAVRQAALNAIYDA